eukprot:5148458-Pyramimonas_sp.AAC.1
MKEGVAAVQSTPQKYVLLSFMMDESTFKISVKGDPPQAHLNSFVFFCFRQLVRWQGLGARIAVPACPRLSSPSTACHYTVPYT